MVQQQFVTRCNQGAFDLLVLPSSQRRDPRVAKSVAEALRLRNRTYDPRPSRPSVITSSRSQPRHHSRGAGWTVSGANHAHYKRCVRNRERTWKMNGFDLEWRCQLGSIGTHALEKTQRTNRSSILLMRCALPGTWTWVACDARCSPITMANPVFPSRPMLSGAMPEGIGRYGQVPTIWYKGAVGAARSPSFSIPKRVVEVVVVTLL